MTLNSRQVLNTIGYEIDNRGNVKHSMNQIAIVSLENHPDGGVLRVHGTEDQFFYAGDQTLSEKDLLFPAKVTGKYVYFQGRTDTVRIGEKDFVENAMKALAYFDSISIKKLAG